jgi:tryptophan 2,3-dioxygenase
MSENHDAALTYTSYLAVDDLLKLQKPLSDGPEHDELLFIIIHQTYELWFKQLIHEFAEAQRLLEANDTFKALGVLGRIRTIMKTCVSQVDIYHQKCEMKLSRCLVKDLYGILFWFIFQNAAQQFQQKF